MTSLSFYVHIPFCASRCGYCDFNTYTAEELISAGSSVSRTTYSKRAIAEIGMARAQIADDRPVSTVFFGGGTPTLLNAGELVAILDVIRQEFGLTEDVEVTTEANPDSVTPESLDVLRRGGFNRVSFGHQSSAPHVLATLERTHTSGRSLEAVREAHSVGFEHINMDLIYSTPGETDDDLKRTLDDVLSVPVDHVSAYSLIVEPGTRLAAKVARGEMPMPDDDVAAARYEMISERLESAGMNWYEVSNWAVDGAQCRHNLAYWHSAHWWGVGPGAHSHVDGVRWWNVKHPATYAAKIDDQQLPIADREELSEQTRYIEDVMLRLRLRQGVPLASLTPQALAAAEVVMDQGLAHTHDSHLVLTARGRLLADAVVRTLLDA